MLQFQENSRVTHTVIFDADSGQAYKGGCPTMLGVEKTWLDITQPVAVLALRRPEAQDKQDQAKTTALTQPREESA